MIKSQNRIALNEVANNTKNALISEWRKEHCFKDKNNMRDSGLLPEGIGLTSLLLFLEAFGETEEIIPSSGSLDESGNASLSDIQNLICESLAKVCNMAESGYRATPLIRKEHDSKLFGESCGYLETLTWCLSLSILAVRNEKRGLLSLSDELREKAYELLAKSFDTLIKSQHEDGTWGFTTDRLADKALYYTYIANASLADFFDYILGEIAYTENGNVEENNDILAFLEDKLGYKADSAAEAAREKLNKFLIEVCLPRLPKIADCSALSDDDLSAIGAWKTEPQGDKYYLNLYYTYYLLEMMITSSADKYFEERVSADADALLEIVKPHIPATDYDYYNTFKTAAEDVKFFEDFFKNYYEQALHTSRMHYMVASRIDDFWNYTASELTLQWSHSTKSKEVKTATDRVYISDPTILPMALRANTMYSFYVTEKPEITIERLFADVCQNVYSADASDSEGGDYCTENLWDSASYNLFITERSIESVIDFFDYLNKFESNTPAQQLPKPAAAAPAVPTVTKSPIDLAIEAKIAEYLASEEGQALISKNVSTAVPAAPEASAVSESSAPLAISTASIIGYVKELSRNINATAIPNDEDPSNEISMLIAKLVDLHEALESCKIRKIFAELEDNKGDIDYESNISKSSNIFDSRYRELLGFIAKDLSDKKYSLSELYVAVKRLKDKGN